MNCFLKYYQKMFGWDSNDWDSNFKAWSRNILKTIHFELFLMFSVRHENWTKKSWNEWFFKNQRGPWSEKMFSSLSIRVSEVRKNIRNDNFFRNSVKFKKGFRFYRKFEVQMILIGLNSNKSELFISTKFKLYFLVFILNKCLLICLDIFCHL